MKKFKMVEKTPDQNKEIINVKEFPEKITEDVIKNVVKIFIR